MALGLPEEETFMASKATTGVEFWRRWRSFGCGAGRDEGGLDIIISGRDEFEKLLYIVEGELAKIIPGVVIEGFPSWFRDYVT
jgi:hypothetical protein